jgi:CO/xanthine dehydrogenase FAD-binding subunit
MEYLITENIESAIEQCKKENSYFIAGGTDLVTYMAEFVLSPRVLIDISRLKPLREITADQDVRIGAAVTLTEAGASPVLPACLSAGARAVGSPQIRNLGTVGGNICNASPCGDTLAPLLVLDAELVLVSGEGERKVAAGDFFTGPKQTVRSRDELLREIILPGASREGISGFRKIGKRKGQAISQVNCAVWLKLEREKIRKARVAVGSAAPVPLRLEKTERYLMGKAPAELEQQVIGSLAAEEVTPIDDVRSTADYRRTVVGGLLWDIIEEILKPAAGA